MTYREKIFNICNNTDFKDENEAIGLAMFLADELTVRHDILIAHEKKLREVMSAKDWTEYCDKIAKELTIDWFNRLPDGDFKDFAMENGEAIIDGTYNPEED